MVTGGQGRGGDLGKVAELRHQDHHEAHPRHPPDPGLVAVHLHVLVAVLMTAAQQQHRPRREQHRHDDLERPVRQQAKQAARRDRQPHVHREPGGYPDEHPRRPEPAAKDEAGERGLIR